MQYSNQIDVQYLPMRKYKLQPFETWCSNGVVWNPMLSSSLNFYKHYKINNYYAFF
jgi:hypothetical protein